MKFMLSASRISLNQHGIPYHKDDQDPSLSTRLHLLFVVEKKVDHPPFTIPSAFYGKKGGGVWRPRSLGFLQMIKTYYHWTLHRVAIAKRHFHVFSPKPHKKIQSSGITVLFYHVWR